MKILKAELSDLEEILKVQHLSFLSEAEEMDDYDIQPLKEKISEVEEVFNKGIILKATEENKIIGSIRGYSKDKTCYIEKLFVHPDYRGKGYSSKLIEALFELFNDCNHFKLYTSAISNRNIKLYEKFGFRIYKEEYIGNSRFVYFIK